MVYLDNAATTPLSPKAIDKLYEINQSIFGNPSSLHHYGREASRVLRGARQSIANSLDTQANRIIFTSGGSEANNLAIKGYALANKDKGKHLIATAIEHHALLHPLEDLVQHHGFEVTLLEPQNGQITAQQVKSALRDDTILVSIMHANNETGQILPIAEIAELLASHPAVFHVDAVQTIGKLPFHPERLGVDLLSASAHKFHGPKGVGFLYTNTNRLSPQIQGGNQEDKRRAGTENLAAIAAMAVALEDSLLHWEENFAKVSTLRDNLLQQLESVDYYLNLDVNQTLPYVLNIGFPGQLNERLLMQLDLAGIAVSSGSACTAGNIEPSHVLAAYYGANSPRLKESIRISFSKMNTADEIQQLTNKIKEILGD